MYKQSVIRLCDVSLNILVHDTAFMHPTLALDLARSLPNFLKIDYLLTTALLVSERLRWLDNDDFQKQRGAIPSVIKVFDESVAAC